jgi:glycosyltransferase involved in cell wall biosynthesis
MKYKSPTALFVGRLAKMKGIKDAIEAIRLVNNELETKWTLLIVGKGTDAYEHELKRMATKMLGNKHIKFLGYLTEEEKFEEMEKSWVLVVPSSREGWGMIVGEANHVGTQVIGYNSPGLTDSLSYYSSDNIIVNRNPKSLAKAIKLLKQPDKIHGKIKPGWEILEKEILTDIYEEK